MTNKQIAIGFFIGVLVGCAGSQVGRVATVSAQPTATPGAFSECVAFRLNNDEDLEDLAENAKSIQGWTPVGGGDHRVILCR